VWRGPEGLQLNCSSLGCSKQRKAFVKFAPIGVLLVVIACSSSRYAQVIVGPQDATRHVKAYSSDGLPAGFRQVARTQETWDSLWSRMAGEPADWKPGSPTIDFTQEQLLVVGMGWFGSGGFSIRIDSVLVRGQTLIAHVRSEYRCSPTDIVSVPVDVVRVPRRFTAVRFVNRRVGEPHCLAFYRDHPG
jgi:hypothetical protein